MDLVSNTLDKYLKHRFNGNSSLGTDQRGGDNTQKVMVPTKAANNNSLRSSNTSVPQAPNNLPNGNSNQTNPKESLSNGTKDDDNQLPNIHNISFSNTRPCCVALRDDLHYLAAGFENSHIHLWDFNDDLSLKSVDESTTLLAHSGPVYGIEFLNNNDLMLSCSEDTTIRLWCLNTKCNVYVYRGHSYPIWSLAVASQGNLFASASMDATARLWQLDRITPIRIFCGHDDDVECVRFHPNEKYIATGSSDSTVRLWSTADGKMVRLMVGHKNPITSLSFLPDGKFLASASRDGVIKVWNLANNCVISELSAPPSYTISFSQEQKFIVSCGIDNILHLWQVDKTNLIERRKLDFGGRATDLIQSHFHRDNKLFTVGYKVGERTQRNK